MEINLYSGTVIDCKHAKEGPWCKHAEVVHDGYGGHRRCPEFTGDKCDHRETEQKTHSDPIACNPHDMIGNSYSGPSRMLRLGDLPNQEGFRFRGVNHFGDVHECEVRKNHIGCHSVYRIDTGEPYFTALVGWLHTY